jgi:two-component system CheB/CheR fusion protein
MNKKQSPPKHAKAKKKISHLARAASATNDSSVGVAEAGRARTKPFMVVGVGASAGGLEAFKQLLAHLPVDTGMAFVLIMHLDPTHESALTELLAQVTQIPVSEIQDGMPVAPNHVYVIPPNTSLAIEGGSLRLGPRQRGRGRRRPIDSFLRSLAKDQNARAIGVILSGTADDGARGLEAIKAVGGITFAQIPESAKFEGMPRSAIATGHVDFVLNAEGVAKEIARISRRFYPASNRDEEQTARVAGKNDFSRILTLLRQATNVDFSLYKTNTLHRRIRRRMILNKLDGLEEYARYLSENAEEVKNLYEDILIKVTSFFRNRESFDVLKEKIFPQLIERRASDGALRIWVMGCSTGEEVYSIAMVFTEFTSERSVHIPVQIFATDVNEKSLEHARAGLYSKNITADVSPERLRRFFTETKGGYRISKPLRDMCVFARQNVAADPHFSRMDLISCRNLLIYLESAVQKRLMPMLHHALNPNGILWLGSSETIGVATELFEPEDKKHRFYSRKPTAERPRISYFTGSEARKNDRVPLTVEIMDAPAASGEKEARREADRIILARYAPASALVDEDLNVLQLRGDTTLYLERSLGKTTGNLLKLAHEELVLPIRAAVAKARKEEKFVRKKNLQVKYDGVTSNVNLEVILLQHLPPHERFYLVLFETAEAEAEGRGQKAGGGRRKSEGQRVKQLSQELAAARDYLQTVIEDYEAATEELQSTGEEVQSSNEELQSINEELETSKEELESSNEELTTLNEELNNRNTELARLNSDLVNLLDSVQIPILMLDSELRIRRFTPAAEKLLNLLRTDVGRPIGDLKLNLDYPDLERLIAEVIDTVSVKEREAQDNAGCWHLLRAHPYKTPSGGIDGAVVAILDIDALKRNEREIKAERDYAQAVLRATRAPLIVLRDDLRVHAANEAFYETFKVTPEVTEGRLIYDLGDRQWDTPQLRRLLEETIRRDSVFNDYEVTLEFPTIGKRAMLLNARLLDDLEGFPERILLSIDDMTERIEALAMARESEALRKSEERFRTLADNAPALIWVNSPTGCEFVNREYLEFLGVGEAEVLGAEWMSFVHPEDLENYINAYGEAASRHGRFETEFRFRRSDGEYRWMRSVGTPRFEDGEFKGYVGSSLDIHERRIAETKMAHMAAIVESSDDAIISKDLNGTIVSWNKGAEKLFGYTAAEAVGKPVTILIPLDRVDEEPEILQRIRRGELIDHYETVRRRKDGGEIAVSLTVSPIREKNGKVIGASKIARDITSRKQAEERIKEALAQEQEARGEAERANRSKDEFIALVSHELRSPLNAVLGWTQTMRERPHDEQIFNRATEVIERNAGKQLQLIEDLLDSARVISGKLKLEVGPTDVAEVIEKAEEVLRPAADAKGISLDARLDRSVGQITGDPDRLQQVVWNLLSNAVKFTEEGGRVEVILERIDPYIRIIVRDTGRGIPQEFMPYVFDRYRQAEASGARRSGGLGLGLSLTRQLVEMHGGSVTAESEGEGKGATFTVKLPVRAIHTAEPEPVVLASDRKRSLAGVWAVVVDDEADARELVTLVLELNGARVTAFGSAGEALNLLTDDTGPRPDILISDISMPGEDGVSLISKLREWERTRSGAMPAIALTAYGCAKDRAGALKAGFQKHMTKPAEPSELIVVVGSLITNGAQSDKNGESKDDRAGSHDAQGGRRNS